MRIGLLLVLSTLLTTMLFGFHFSDHQHGTPAITANQYADQPSLQNRFNVHTSRLSADEKQADESDESRYLSAVRNFADQVLKYGRDRYGDEHTPLFADEIDVNTLESPNKRSNFARQQNLMRTLVTLTELTDEPLYRDAAADAYRHMIANYRSPTGLFRWGGYIFIDLESGEYRGPRNNEHSMRGHIPFYDFLWEVDPDATLQFIRNFWNSHVLNWETLEICRRGGAERNWNREMGALWDNEYNFAEPFIRTHRTLTFKNAGTDLIYAAGFYYQKTGDEKAWEWGKRLSEKYVRARHPETGLGAVQYNILEATREVPDEGPLEGSLTYTHYGDRAKNQFSRSGSSSPQDEFYNPVKDKIAGDDMPVAREPWTLFRYGPRHIYQVNAPVELLLGEQLGEEGIELIDWTTSALKAYARHAYDPETDTFIPIWADGSDLSGLQIPRTGYYGTKGDSYSSGITNHIILLSYARAYRLSGDDELWSVIRSVSQGLGLGDLGKSPGHTSVLNWDTEHAEPHTIFSLLELKKLSGNEDYLRMAEKIADNILDNKIHNGLFLSSPDNSIATVDTIAALALLTIEAYRTEQVGKLPPILPLRGGILLGG